MDFTKIDPTMVMSWNDVFWYLSVISLALAIFQFGVPYTSLKSFPKFLIPKKMVGVKRMRMNNFLGRISVFSLLVFASVAFIFLFKSIYSIVFLFQVQLNANHDVNAVNGLVTNIVTFAIFIIVCILIVFWVRSVWRSSENDNTAKTEVEQLKDVIKVLNSKLDKFDKLDKLDKIDELVKQLKNSNSNPTHPSIRIIKKRRIR